MTYDLIKKEYDAFYNFLLKNGNLLWKDTKLGFWGKVILEEVHEIFKEIKLEKYNHFLDLGSGDGSVTLIASLFTNAKGIEIDDDLLKAGVNIKNKLKLNANFIHGDFEEHDINQYDIIFINPDKPFHRGLDQLLSNYKGTIIVYSEHFLPNNMKQIQDLRKKNLYAILYKN